MTQGALKKSKSTAASSKRTNALGPKKGQRSIAPKKASLVKQRKITKKLTSGLITKTERNLAERAGHLELLAGGKKDKEKPKDKNAAKRK